MAEEEDDWLYGDTLTSDDKLADKEEDKKSVLTETAASTAADKDSLENNDTVKGEVEEERAKMDVDVLAEGTDASIKKEVNEGDGECDGPPGESVAVEGAGTTTNVAATVDEEEDDDDDDDIEVTIQAPSNTSGSVLRSAPSGLISSATVPHRFGQNSQTLKSNAPVKGIDLNAPGNINGVAVIDYNLNEDEKPWMLPGADQSDYFNYGFNESSWNIYCDKQKSQREENAEIGNGLLPPPTLIPNGKPSLSLLPALEKLARPGNSSHLHQLSHHHLQQPLHHPSSATANGMALLAAHNGSGGRFDPVHPISTLNSFQPRKDGLQAGQSQLGGPGPLQLPNIRPPTSVSALFPPHMPGGLQLPFDMSKPPPAFQLRVPPPGFPPGHPGLPPGVQMPPRLQHDMLQGLQGPPPPRSRTRYVRTASIFTAESAAATTTTARHAKQPGWFP